MSDYLDRDTVEKYMLEFESGITSFEVIRIFKEHGIRFSEASLRKYIQMGLLPRSHRTGTGEKGRNRGSRGLYPVNIIKNINDIKRMLVEGLTLDDIVRSTLRFRKEIHGINQELEHLFSSMSSEVLSAHFDRGLKPIVQEDLSTAKITARTLIEQLENIDSTLTNPKPTL
ncbi:MAG: MerR family transcriptional regulator [Deltaproteobacteria bacterium]|nr:MerR family transcriptional regulator [Deltaproteobacteria bacterium]